MKSIKEFTDGKNEYADARKVARPEIIKVIDKYDELPDSKKDKTPLLYFILNSGTPDFKMSRERAGYVNKTDGKQKCSNCRFAYQKVINGKVICSQIRGGIDLDGWCKLWENEDE